MGKLTKVLEKSGYTIDLSGFEEPEVVFELVKENQGVGGHTHQDFQENLLEKDRSERGERVDIAPGLRPAVVIELPGKLSESFQTLQSEILRPALGRTVPKSIMITSVLPGEGKSFITANLGRTFAGIDQNCMLVDCDLRDPRLAASFGAENLCGVADYLLGDENLQGLIQETSVATLSLLASGVPHLDPDELLGSVRIHDLVEELRSNYPDRFLIFDTPALQIVPESIVLSHAVDGVVLVTRHGVSSKEAVKRAVFDIGVDKILGIITNGDDADLYKPGFVSTDLYTD